MGKKPILKEIDRLSHVYLWKRPKSNSFELIIYPHLAEKMGIDILNVYLTSEGKWILINVLKSDYSHLIKPTKFNFNGGRYRISVSSQYEIGGVYALHKMSDYKYGLYINIKTIEGGR